VLAATTGLGLPTVRSDLLGRFGAEPFVIAPLRDRVEDVGPLISHFVPDPEFKLEPAAFRALALHAWPHNVRELQKVVQQGRALGSRGAVRLEDLPDAVRAVLRIRQPERPNPRVRPPRAELEALLRQHRGNVAEVARALNRRWHVVHRWITHDHIDLASLRD
jgi:DNA-binding NtrC family response regulator